VNAQKIEAEDESLSSPAAAAVHVATATAEKTGLTMSLVREVLVKIWRLQQQRVAERRSSLPTAAAGRRPPVCWDCGSGGHFLRSFPHGGRK